MSRALDVVSSTAASVVRLGAGLFARPAARRPEKLLELYEFEACPFCRRVREALSELDFDAMIYPCPRGGTRFRPRVVALGGKAMFPFLVDPNAEGQPRAMYESADIVRYLRETYGATAPSFSAGPIGIAGGAVAAALRGGLGRAVQRRSGGFAGTRATAAAMRPWDGQPLELWSFEASPYSRLVREALCELEIPYVLHNVAKGSPRREAFVARSGKMMVPYLVDPNTGQSMFESADIVRYLRTRYAA
jgi:glutathione S-transferase